MVKETIAEKIIREIGKDFITAKDFGEMYEVKEDALEILNFGVGIGIFMVTRESDGNLQNKEFAVKQVISKKDKEEFSKFIIENFGELENQGVVLSSEEKELREGVLLNLSMNKRREASEIMVQEIKKATHIYTTRTDEKPEMWMYMERDGIYSPEGRTYIKEYCRKILGEIYTGQFVNEVIIKIEADTLIQQDEFFKNNYVWEIPVENGILNIKTKKIIPFTPHKIFFNKLPIIYNPSKKCPKIEEHFKTVLKDTDDAKVMFELIGYCLLKDSKFEKAFMFSGYGRNGKTKTMELIKRFLGVSNCSALGLTQLNDNSFEVSELFGKMVNLAGDLSYHDLKETGILKQLIGRDLLSAKRKFKNTIPFVSYAKLIFACNELPKIYDLTDGFWTKWVLLEFPYKFITKEEMSRLPEKDRADKKIMNTEIIKEITTPGELSGLLNEALEHLKVILKQKDFSYSKGTEEVKNMWIRMSDSFMAFCLDNIEEDNEGRISKDELRKRYQKYCRVHKGRGVRVMTDKPIKHTLGTMFGAYDTQDADRGERYWKGIKFKNGVNSEKANVEIVKISKGELDI